MGVRMPESVRDEGAAAYRIQHAIKRIQQRKAGEAEASAASPCLSKNSSCSSGMTVEQDCEDRASESELWYKKVRGVLEKSRARDVPSSPSVSSFVCSPLSENARDPATPQLRSCFKKSRSANSLPPLPASYFGSPDRPKVVTVTEIRSFSYVEVDEAEA
eukprot:TRINITY_DN5788_c0_g1_i1.p3 TRINITY_DN5788_c0_g1~~TRINITY_DN5788_c0_g1_i1.p3  ORF type:complete len:160 (+),score=50.63 TRINITY_DN5788_c0_g1_i1:63-542(+)